MPVVSKKKPAAAASSSQRVHKTFRANLEVKIRAKDVALSEHEESDTEGDDDNYILARFNASGAIIIPYGAKFNVPCGSILRSVGPNCSLTRPFTQSETSEFPMHRAVLTTEGVLTAPPHTNIRLPGSVESKEIYLPAGTLLKSLKNINNHILLASGGGHLQSSVTIRDDMFFDQSKAFQLSKPLFTRHGFKVQNVTVLPDTLHLGDEMEIDCELQFSGTVMRHDITNGYVQVTAISGERTEKGHRLPFAAVLPAGMELERSTSIPSSTTLPAGTMIHPDSWFESGTLLSEGLYLPGGAEVPAHVFCHIKMVNEPEGETLGQEPKDPDIA